MSNYKNTEAWTAFKKEMTTAVNVRNEFRDM